MGPAAQAAVSEVDQRFRRCHRLQCRADFDRVRREGKTYRSQLFSVIIRPDPTLPATRLGIIAGRRFGGAVSRSRIRRHIREAFRRRRAVFSGPADMLVIPRPEADSARGTALAGELERLWRKAGLLPPGAAQTTE